MPAGRLLLFVLVGFTIMVFPDLEQHREDTASRANAAANICHRQCHTPSPPFFAGGREEVSPQEMKGSTAKACAFALRPYSLFTMYHITTNFARLFQGRTTP